MKGKVYLVGAGPGNEGLITKRGYDLLKKAEVLVYDRLAGSNLVAEAPENCEKIYVGKQSSNHAMKQDDINQVLVDKALENKMVVRLKGGDPYVFGRGGEEAIKLYDNNVEFEVVPGITSPIGGLAYAGIPITHRDYASSFHIITGHLKEDGKEHDWDALSKLNGTLVFLMGMSNLERITDRLMEFGKSKTTPVAIVHWASHPNQQVVEGDLSNIVERVKEAGVSSPSLIVVGEVVKLRNPLNFFERKPLHGKRIVVTRATSQSSSMLNKIRELGGSPIALPMIKIEKLNPIDEIKRVMKSLNTYNYVVFTSVNGINRFFEELEKYGKDARSLGGVKVVCVGEPTRELLMTKGIRADFVPDRFVAEGVLELLKPMVKSDDRILIPRAFGARPLLVEELEKKCFVNELQLYETVGAKLDDDFINDTLENVDYITFTSASTVRYFAEVMNGKFEKLGNTRFISIGPITSEEAKKYGLSIYKEAKVHTIDGIINTILKCTQEDK